MNPVFDISPVNFIAEQTNLFVEVSDESFTYFLQDDTNKMITGLTLFHFDKKNTEADTSGILKNIFQQQTILNNNYKKIFVSYAFNESLLIPGVYYNENENRDNLNLIYGDLHEGVILTDHVLQKNIYNTFRISQAIHDTMTEKFRGATFTHQYSTLLKQLPSDGEILKVIFYQNKIVIALLKEGMLQMMQTFKYTAATDVVFHMLNICEQFKTKEISVKISGMIEKDSALFKEIYKYFLHIDFDNLPGDLSYDERIKELPNHFFSHLFSIALCE